MKTLIALLPLVLLTSVCAAAELSLFTERQIEGPPLGLLDQARHAMPPLFPRVEPSVRHTPAVRSALAQMPIIAPKTGVDYKMLVKAPDAAVDYKLTVKRPDSEPAK